MSVKSYLRNGKTYYEVLVKIRNPYGKQIYKRKRGLSSEVKARKLEYQLKRELENKSSEFSEWTWKGWHQECLSRMRLSLKQATVMNYDGDLKKWLPKDWMERKLQEISKTDVYELIFENLKEGASANSRKNVYKRVRRIFEMAVEEGILARNPAHGIKVKIPAPVKKVLNVNEADLLLKAAKDCNHPFYRVWAFALFTGMRSGEMYAIQWKDIDLETGLISVSKQWTSKDGLHPTKSNRNRVVPISPELRSLLTELKLKGSHRETFRFRSISKVEGVVEKKEWDQTIEDLVLPRLQEWRYGEQARVLADFCRGAGITEIKFHDLRATFITNLLTQGVPLVKVMAIVGHSRMSTTDEYLRLAGVNIKGATEKLGYRMPVQESGKVIRLFSATGKHP